LLAPAVAFAQSSPQVDLTNAIYEQLKQGKARAYEQNLPSVVIVVKASGIEKSVSPSALDLLDGMNDGQFGKVVSYECKHIATDTVSCLSNRAHFKERMTFRTDFEFVGAAVAKVRLFKPIAEPVNG
jgi:hypothetical protein